MNIEKLKDHAVFFDVRPHVLKQFWIYHEKNPHVFELFRKYALELKRAGRRHYGVGALMERIRWHLLVETQGEEFKMNNNYRSCYARMLIAQDSFFADFFETRSPKNMWD